MGEADGEAGGDGPTGLGLAEVDGGFGGSVLGEAGEGVAEGGGEVEFLGDGLAEGDVAGFAADEDGAVDGRSAAVGASGVDAFVVADAEAKFGDEGFEGVVDGFGEFHVGRRKTVGEVVFEEVADRDTEVGG